MKVGPGDITGMTKKFKDVLTLENNPATSMGNRGAEHPGDTLTVQPSERQGSVRNQEGETGLDPERSTTVSRIVSRTNYARLITGDPNSQALKKLSGPDHKVVWIFLMSTGARRSS